MVKKSVGVGEALKKSGVKARKRRTQPLWRGPSEDGITQSLLSRFLVCPERFRLLVCEGLQPHDQFNHRLEYGQMWHICEENLLAGEEWEAPLKTYAAELTRKYPLAQEQIVGWYRVCMIQFPIYVKFWAKHGKKLGIKPVSQEHVFEVDYVLPSARMVKLRGKFDAINLHGAGLYLQENKTKADIDEIQLRRQLKFDLQTMMYLIAADQMKREGHELFSGHHKKLIEGVLYNVVRRPLSGGKNTIRRHQPTKSNPRGETEEEFYMRLMGLIAEEPDYYFMRWLMQVSHRDIEVFKKRFLNPILERLCDWWEWISEVYASDEQDPFGSRDDGSAGCGGLHYQTPFGFYNVLAEGGNTELDEYILTGNETGLSRVDALFSELQ